MPFEFLHNWPLKLSCLALALLIWILTTGESQRIKELLVPVEYINVPSGMEISGEVPDQISVRFQAPEPILQRITEENIDARVDLSGLDAGDQFLPIPRDRFRVPGATLVRVEPELIPIRLVRRLEKEVPVKPRIEGEPPAGYEMVDYRVEPASVVVVGPEDAVREVQRATTGSILVDGFTSPRELMVHAIAEAAGDRRVRLKDPDRLVKVEITIREKPLRKLFRGIPVRTTEPGIVARLDPERVDVSVEGPTSLVNSLATEDVRVEVDLNGLEPRRRAHPVEARVTLVGLPADRTAEVQARSTTPIIQARIQAGGQGTP